MAHTLLLNAMAMKLQRSHYEESWKAESQGLKMVGFYHENPMENPMERWGFLSNRNGGNWVLSGRGTHLVGYNCYNLLI